MSKARMVLSVFVVLALIAGLSAAGRGARNNGAADKPSGCVTIPMGFVFYSPGHYLAGYPLAPGYDVFGYNFQARMFSGSYANAYLGGYGFPPYEGDDAAYLSENPAAAGVWCWPYREDNLIMKWNEAWLSTKDCDGDGKLDRHFGFPSYKGSGAWLTNHQSGVYLGGDGKEYSWNYFCKIAAVPADAVKTNGVWHTAGGVEIGPDIWGEFAVIQEVYNDNGTGDHGLLYKSPAGPGFGKWDEVPQ
ncbi:MAG TPA: hypothetical protein PL086_11185 [Candidatus Aminicenantes bacterium]|nr:hypothetical protein [Candidatus Aminicenantes bacterium]